MPAHRVIASFGNLSELETQNLKQAIAASRNGESVVLAPRTPQKRVVPKVQRNLAYLDVATCYRTWGDWGLTELIDRLACEQRDVSLGEVIAALTVQRCVAPASKLEASRWYSRTALPELQGIAPARFNNARVHRALESLDGIESPLQEQLARRIETRQAGFACLFLDCTDAWFVGQGPEMAHKRVTKEGLMRRLVGIALLCDGDGFPLRWKTLPGNHHEAVTMTGIIDQVLEAPWAHEVPLVVDRAMGRGVTVEAMLARDVRFVTAVPAPEITGYSHRIPLGRFDSVDLGESATGDGAAVSKDVLQRLRKTALDAGFETYPKGRYVLDLGVFEKGEGEGATTVTASWLAPSRARGSLQLARRIRSQLDSGMTYPEVAELYGYVKIRLQQLVDLLSLDPSLQKRIDAGEADRLRVNTLRDISRLPAEVQTAAFEQACREVAASPPLPATAKLARAMDVPALKLRGVVLFSPERFVEQRRAATKALAELDELIETINRRLASPGNRQSRESAIGKVTDALKHRKMLDTFTIGASSIEIDGRAVVQLSLERNDAVWQRRRQLDGINLIVAHPQFDRSAQELVELYVAKDQVEKDFQEIKSVLALRPVHHFTDPKLRAHVTICVLALLLERTLEKRLRDAGTKMTATCALTELKSGHLNLYGGAPAPLYSATQPSPEQRRILAALGLEDLDDDDKIADLITPR